MAQLATFIVFAFCFIAPLLAGEPTYSDCRQERGVTLRCKNVDWTSLPTTPVPAGTQYLAITNSQIQELPTNGIESSDLKGLIITGNTMLSTIGSDAFKGLPNLEILDLMGNQLSTVYSDAFRGLDNLLTLNLSTNSMTLIDDTIFSHTPNLISLDLSRNQISSVPGKAFHILSKLTEVFLSYNQISSVDNKAFEGTTMLRTIELDHNLLNKVPIQLIAMLGRLNKLKLGYNQLTGLPVMGMLRVQSAITELYLESNKFETLPGIFMNSLPSLLKFAFGNNPINCVCDMDWLRQVQQKKNNRPANIYENFNIRNMNFRIIDADEIICESPSFFAGLPTEKLNSMCSPNECLSLKPLCGPKTKCVDAPNGYACVCIDGYYREYPHLPCVDRNECLYIQTTACSKDAVCQNTIGSYTCTCRPGFKGDGNTCVDINECESRKPPCHSTNVCQNTIGSYFCECKPGFKSSVAGSGSNECKCVAGYVPSQGRCEDIDECAQNPCTDSQCVNTPGSFKCQPCAAGFRFNGTKCSDINECTFASCRANSRCFNTIGSYDCDCLPGFHLTDGECVDFDECLYKACPYFNSVCHNTPGSYTCSCQPGFTAQGKMCVRTSWIQRVVADMAQKAMSITKFEAQTNTATKEPRKSNLKTIFSLALGTVGVIGLIAVAFVLKPAFLFKRKPNGTRALAREKEREALLPGNNAGEQ